MHTAQVPKCERVTCGFLLTISGVRMATDQNANISPSWYDWSFMGTGYVATNQVQEAAAGL
jgi:hypothetical protein